MKALADGLDLRVPVAAVRATLRAPPGKSRTMTIEPSSFGANSLPPVPEPHEPSEQPW